MSNPPEKILIIDDDATILHLMKHTLQHEGYEVFTRNSGDEILAFLERQEIHTVFLDVFLRRPAASRFSKIFAPSCPICRSS